VTSKHALWL